MLSLSKTLIVLALGAAVAMAIAAPAGAESAKKKHRHVKPKVTERQSVHRGTDKFPAGRLYYNGNEYLGDDPDPNIRFQLWRDLGAHFGGESN